MSRFLLFLGSTLVILGIVGVIVGFTGMGNNFIGMISHAVDPTAEDLCSAGETLAQEDGADEYTAGEGYRHTVRYFCVSARGERREVTGDFVKGVFSQAFDSLPALFLPIIGGCTLTVGIIFTVLGAIFSARRRLIVAATGQPTSGGTYAFDFPQAAPVRSSTRPQDTDLAAKLRQLDEARDSGLITEAEYQQKRQQILDSIQ